MKSPLRKLRGFTLPHKGRREPLRPPAKLDELVQAAQDMLDMRNCYDSLVSAAATTTNSAYEFSEALEEMGTCLLQKTSLSDDDDSGRVLLMLGKAQFELQKLLDDYRSHIVQTITTPSESLLKELHIVEEMKRQCDDKRDVYKFMLAAQREKGRSRNVKGETYSSQQLQAAQEDYEEDATLFIFRLKSLKQGQSRSLMTQAARHHAAQLYFFRKGLKSLEVIEPYLKAVAEEQHIDYQFSGLDDDATENEDESYDGGYDHNDDSDMSFDYGPTDQGQDVISASRNSMEIDLGERPFIQASSREPPQVVVDKSEEEVISFREPSYVSKSAPIFSDKSDSSEKTKYTRPSSTMKFHTYVLPTPADAKFLVSTGVSGSISSVRMESNIAFPKQLWHSSPLDPYKFVNKSRERRSPSPTRHTVTQAVLKESNTYSVPMRIPPPMAEELSLPQINPHTFDSRKSRRYAFSGPLTSKPPSNRPMYTPSVEYSTVKRVPTSRSSVSPRVSPAVSPPHLSPPKINELHELPRPPISYARRTRPASLIGHSAPLVSRGQERSTSSKMPTAASRTASPLPTPTAAMARSFSIPSSSQRIPVSAVAKLSEDFHNLDLIEEVASPPLTPMLLSNIQHPPPTSVLANQVNRI